ncbi:acetyl esterase/lipase [Streptomyces sp. 3330]|uniref:alpha/beta hydrolase n=1 Tax=Streptomyces sp. 3330 TaxID=2817755 RepID=UPI0028578A01|nr:alpha/beta hydrolase [Streptomyces sp. 3330]MDR6976012.1 acetyl esterase/lipase [Streptomyces sp. 3330]
MTTTQHADSDDARTDGWAGPPRFLPPVEPLVRPDGSRHYAGVTYAVAFGYRPLQLDLWVPVGAERPSLVVWIHGGGWMFGDRRVLPETLRPGQMFDELLAAGLAVATIDYRHALEAPFPAQLHDAKAAVRYLRAHAEELGIDTSRVAVAGESAGGHLAALVGLTSHRPDLEGSHGVVGPSSAVDTVLDWYGPSDLSTMPRQTAPAEVLAALPEELRTPPEDQLVRGLDGRDLADASPITHVTPEAPSFLLVHGTADWLVPYAQSEALAAALTACGATVRLVPVAGAGHIFSGCADVSAVVRLSVDHLAGTLRGIRT